MDSAGERRNVAARIGGWSARHKWPAILLWIAFVVAATVLGSAAGIVNMATYEDENGGSRRAQQILDGAGFPDTASETVLIQARNGDVSVDDPEFRQAVQEVRAAVEATGWVGGLSTPYDAEDPAPATADRRTALVLFQIKGDPGQAVERVGPVLVAVAGVQDRHPGLRIEQAGNASAANVFGAAIDDDLRRAEGLALPITAVILLIAFGTLLPMIIPLTLSMTAFVAATGLLALGSHLLHVGDATTNLMLLVGLAVGVDYSLFYVRREREERAKGHAKERALRIAAATSGRAVLISGVTVIVAMAGMFLTGNGVFMSFALGTILVVLTAVVGSVTVLPAILAVFGDAIDARVVHGIVRVVTRGRVTWPRRLGGRTGGGRLWNAVLGAVLRRPVVSATLATGALLALAVPAFSMTTGQAGIDDLQGHPIAATVNRIDQAFPGGNEPASVVVRAPDVTSQPVRDAIRRFKDMALASGEANEPFNVQVNPAGTVAHITIGIAGQGAGDRRSQRAIESLRETVVPQTIGRAPGAEAFITGSVAGTIDFNTQLRRTGPLVVAFVFVLAFGLLLASFRSIVVALKSIILNLLSVGAAYGVLTLVFQEGYGERLLGFTSTGMIVNWLPLFLFVILFGLSTDYHVFIISRIREAYDGGRTTPEAIAHGIKTTAGVVTSAALIMVAVFSVFSTMSLLSFMQMGVGLAAAILIDATIVRAVLLPATMTLLGRWNWYLPRWLTWLPEPSYVEVSEPARLEADDEAAGLRPTSSAGEPAPASAARS